MSHVFLKTILLHLYCKCADWMFVKPDAVLPKVVIVLGAVFILLAIFYENPPAFCQNDVVRVHIDIWHGRGENWSSAQNLVRFQQ